MDDAQSVSKRISVVFCHFGAKIRFFSLLFAKKLRYLHSQRRKLLKMRKVIGIGETVLDIIFKNDQPIGAVPGGSAFNGIISLGRSGVNTTFISEAGNDRVGKKITDFLKDNGVSAGNINVYPDSKSPISLAFLNDQNDAEYIFYKDHPHDQLDFVYPDVHPDDVVMFSSYYAVNPVIRPQVVGFLDYARLHGAILYYDVNFRSSHQDEVMRLTPNILENLEYADIVRGSKEDFEVMFKKNDPDAVYRSQVSFYCKKFIYTQGADPVELRADEGFSKQYPVEPAETVSTIGAGDNFNAGFVYGLIKYNITRETIDAGLSEQQWDSLIDCAQRFSANCCKSINNSIDKEFGEQMKAELSK
jgi:fructokinase